MTRRFGATRKVGSELTRELLPYTGRCLSRASALIGNARETRRARISVGKARPDGIRERA